MGKLEQVSVPEMPEVMEIAWQLYEQDQTEQEEDEQREYYRQAAEELDLPPEYLERAAAIHQVRQAQRRRQRRRWKIAALALVGLALAFWTGYRATHRPPPAPLEYSFSASPLPRWTLQRNPESQARLAYAQPAGSDGAAVLRVERFGLRSRDGTFFVNLDTADVPATLAGYHTVAFRLQGAGLSSIRLYLEGSTQRWRSPLLPVTTSWKEDQLRLDQFEYLTRRSPAAPWHRQTYRPPRKVERLSFKVGHFVNPSHERGEVAIDSLRFE